MKNEGAWRFVTVHIALALVALAIVFRIIYIQNSPAADQFRDESKRALGTWQVIQPPRGSIFDSQGNLLAGNRTLYEVSVYTPNMTDASEIASAAAVYLGLNYNTVMEDLTNRPNNAKSVVIDKFATPDQEKAFYAFLDSPEGQQTKNLTAVDFTPLQVRSYPEKTLAANVLGFVNIYNSRGRLGVEENYDSLLSGWSVTQWVPNDPNEAQQIPEVAPATSLILTLNRELQSATEQILDNALNTYDAKSGVIVVADPKTGEILAMASSPRIDISHYWDYTDFLTSETPYNPAIGVAYEPGSVFKILTMAAALDKGVVRPDSTYNDVTGTIIVGGVSIHNWDNSAWGTQDMTGCLQHSLNVCLAWVATQMGKEDFYSYMQAFGLGHKTGVDLYGEETGHLKLPADDDWYEVDLGTNAFGQGISVTPIQMIMAGSAIANNGQMPRPHILKATLQGGRQHDMPIEIVGNPISAATAQTLSSMLAVSLENESSLALVPGYRLAGKTGTASIPTSNGYTLASTNASFIGWGPVDDPKFIVYVWLEQPTASIWGSETAAPVFKQVVQKCVVLLGIPPDQVRLSLSGQ